jgi:hypothetical protein
MKKVLLALFALTLSLTSALGQGINVTVINTFQSGAPSATIENVSTVGDLVTAIYQAFNDLPQMWDVFAPDGQTPIATDLDGASTLDLAANLDGATLSLVEYLPGGDGGDGDESITVQVYAPNAPEPEPLKVFADDSVGAIIGIIENIFSDTLPTHWILVSRTSGTTFIGSHMEGNPTLVTAFSIADNEAFDVVDTTLSLNIEDASSPTGGTFAITVSTAGSIEQLAMAIADQITGPVPPDYWELRLPDASGTTSTLILSSESAYLDQTISDLQLAEGTTLTFSTPTPPQLTLSITIDPQAAPIIITVPTSYTVGQLIQEIEVFANNNALQLPDGYQLLYTDANANTAPIFDSSMRSLDITLASYPDSVFWPDSVSYPDSVFEGELPLIFQAMLSIYLPTPKTYFDIAYDEQNSAWNINGELNPALIMQYGILHNFDGFEYAGPDLVISTAAPGTAVSAENTLSSTFDSTQPYISFTPSEDQSGPLYYRSSADINLGGQITLIHPVPNNILVPFDPTQTASDFLATLGNLLSASSAAQVLPQEWEITVYSDMSEVVIADTAQTLSDLGVDPFSFLQLREVQDTGGGDPGTGGGGGGTTSTLSVSYQQQSLSFDGLSTIGELVTAVLNNFSNLPASWNLVYLDGFGDVTLADQSQAGSTDPIPTDIPAQATLFVQEVVGNYLYISLAGDNADSELSVDATNLSTVGDLESAFATVAAESNLTLPQQWVLAIPQYDATTYDIAGLDVLDDPSASLDSLNLGYELLFFDLTPFDLLIEFPNEGSSTLTGRNTLNQVSTIRTAILSTAASDAGYSEIAQDFALYMGATEIPASPDRPLAFYGILEAATLQVDPADPLANATAIASDDPESNALLLQDGNLLFIRDLRDPQSTTTLPITENGRPADYLLFSGGPWPLGDGTYIWESQSAVATEWLDAEQAYVVVFRTDRITRDGSAETDNELSSTTDWLIRYADATGALDWSRERWVSSIIGFEETMGQDLNNEDGDDDPTTGIGFDATALSEITGLDTGGEAVQFDTDSVRAKIDNENNVYIFDETTSPTTVLLITEGNGPAQLQFTYTWQGGSNAAEVVALRKLDEDSGYALIRRLSDTWAGVNGTPETNIGWEEITLGLDGSVSNYKWRQSPVDWEVPYNQDLDGDGSVGFDINNLTLISTADDGMELREDTGGLLYLAKDGTVYAVSDSTGNPQRFQYEETYAGGSTRQIAVGLFYDAVKTEYLLVLKFEETISDVNFSNPYDGSENETIGGGVDGGLTSGDVPSPTRTNYILHFLSLSGSSAVPDWSRQLWTESVTSIEIQYGVDLDGDGTIGINTDSLVAVDTDVFGYRLLKNSDNELFIAEYDAQSESPGYLNPLPIVDEWGGAPQFDYTFRSEGYSENRAAFAVEAVYDETDPTIITGYRLAIQSATQSEANDTYSNWEIHFVDSLGAIRWDQSRYGSITSWEEVFGQDLDGDGSTGFDPTKLNPVPTDPADATAVYPMVDNAGAVYLYDPDLDTWLSVVDQWGGTPTFSQSNTWENGSWSMSVFAAELLPDGSYLLVTRQQDTWIDENNNPYTNTNYEGFSLLLNAENKLELSWDTVARYQSISAMETAFAVDLDGDGVAGVDFSKLAFVPVETDTAGVVLVRSDDSDPSTPDPLFIREGSDPNYTYVSIVDAFGGTPTFSQTWGGEDAAGGGIGSETAYAVEKLDDGNYRFAVLNTFTNTFGEGETAQTEEFRDWIVFTLDGQTDGKAILDWGTSTWTQNIAIVEDDFLQDMNGDGVIGTNYTVGDLNYVSSDDASDTNSPGYPSNAHLLINLNDNTLFIEYPSGTLIPISDINGYGISFGRKGKNPVAVEAIFEADNTTLKGFLLAVRNEDTFGGTTQINWEIHTISTTGIMDWNLSAWASSIIGYEADFQQDLNGDGGIGLDGITLPAVDTDKTGIDNDNGNVDFLFKDAANALYILPSGSSTYIPIKDSYGGAPSFDRTDTWGNNSSSSTAVAVESQDDGTYRLAVKRTEQFEGNAPRTNWEIYTVSAEGILSWDTTVWLESIDRSEPLFRQDLNGDGTVGFSTASLNLSPIGQADTNGIQLQQAENGDLYIEIDETTLIPILDEWGGPERFNYSFSDANSSFNEAAVAIRQYSGSSGTQYDLVVKMTNTYDGQTNVDWQIFTLEADGAIYWENSFWTRSIAKHESDFGWDINGDGTTGIDISLNSSISTDTINQRLERDPEGNLIIVDGSNRVTIVDAYGGTVALEYSDQWNDLTSTTLAFATARQDNATASDTSDDFYVMALKTSETYGDGSTQTFWQLYTVSIAGVIDWGSGTWSSGIAKSEVLFDQDMNGDGTIGVRQSALTTSIYDITGAKLKRDADKGLYIDDPSVSSDPIAIVDPNGGMPLFDFNDSWTGGSFVAVSHAVEKQDDGSYRLVIQLAESFTNNGTTTNSTTWEVFSVSASGVLDWSSSKRNSSVKPYETLFNQDLDGDGTIGQSTNNLTQVATDTTGAKLRLNGSNQLFIRLLDESLITVIDAFGYQPVFHEDYTLPDGRAIVKTPYAVQAFTFTDPDTVQTETRYKLVIRERITLPDGSIDFNYEGYSILADGTILYDTFLRTETAKAWESILNQDINGNGEIETVGAANSVTDVSTDTTGATLQIDEDNILYIRNGTTRLTLKDENGGTPTFAINETFPNGSYRQNAYAVALRDNGTPSDTTDDFYLLAIRELDTFDGVSNVFWKIFRVSTVGILDWDSIEYKLNTELNETRFNQDLNGDGAISNGVANSNSSLADLVETGSNDPEILAKFGNKAQSEMISITAKDGSNKITFFSEGEQNSSKSNFDVELGVVQTITDGVASKMAKDAGLNADIAALTDLLDFSIEIADANKHGKIHKMTFALPEGATNVTYFKLNAKTGKYFEFTYDPATGEGARIESSDPTQDLGDVLAVYIRDNGKYDEDDRLGFIRDPGSLSETGISAWRTNNAISNVEADTDSDGVANIMEYLVDNDPNTADLLRMQATVNDVLGSNHLILQITSNRSSEPTGVTVLLEGSDDLQTFTTVSHTHSVSDNGDGTFTHTYLQDAPIGDPNHKKFLRLNVTETP